ncbi:alpha/beta hydrolase [Aneurinibacillus sp. Ricciae_BoGa-3]|uniref:intracellular short-chain-length polyhydroxyalkanoate depolymerase n=1 Tax=Aneurinibacillus sp. Ricciae_BoGa-3 TaxID=3022697 RepID=UPI0023403B79|nr:alpha/beta hydrolase [Aneurinibacillus sp. Ricciae_BoGa-3]WCK54357.1 alpha/beta hydrolase [Aneurinibacillus sp. Ricciae_BoGa-3]
MAREITLNSVELANGETIAYRQRKGGDQVIVLVHGNMTSSVHWDLLMENLDEAYTIYAVDLRGFGESSYRQPISSLLEFAADVKEWADRLHLTSFVLVGWSAGGGVAMELAAEHPEMVEKLILLASVSTRGLPLFKKDAFGHLLSIPLRTKEEIALDPVQVVPILSAYKNRDKQTLRFIWNATIYTINQPEQSRYEKYLDDMLTQRNLVDVDYALATFNISEVTNVMGPGNGRVNRITMPVLVLSGKRDLVVPQQAALEIRQDIGENASIHYLNAGHSPLIDDLDHLIEEIDAFIR